MPRFTRSGAYSFLLVFTLLPTLAAAQPVLSVSPTVVSVQGYAGTNPSSATVRV